MISDINICIGELAQDSLSRVTELVQEYRDSKGAKQTDIDSTKQYLNSLAQSDKSLILVAHHDNFPVGFFLVSKTFSTVRLKPVLMIREMFITKKSFLNYGQEILSRFVEYLKNYSKEKKYAVTAILISEPESEIGKIMLGLIG